MSDARTIRWDTPDPTTARESLTRDIARGLQQYALLYPALTGFDMLTILGHIAGSVIADAPAERRDEVERHFRLAVERSTKRHDVALDRP